MVGLINQKDTKGTKLYTDEFGVWSTVPGFSKTKVIVSSMGYTRLQNVAGRPLGQPILRPQDEDGYRNVKIFQRRYRNTHLVLCAFLGGALTKDHTADHIAKHDGDWFRERGDDHLENLCWASKDEQRKNQIVLATRRDSEALNKESQRSLVIEGEVERWAFVVPTMKVSTYGRICKKRKSCWGLRFTPRPSKTKRYANVESYGKVMQVHNAVWSAFGSRPLRPGETIDHIDQNRSNNRLSNLRPATKRLQTLNQTRTRGQPSLYCAVQGRPTPTSPWRQWPNQLTAAMELNTELKPIGPQFSQPNISQAARTGCKHIGWQWQFV